MQVTVASRFSACMFLRLLLGPVFLFLYSEYVGLVNGVYDRPA